jgi:hypothetical protein
MRTGLLLLIAALGVADAGWAQTTGPGGGPIAPGPSQPQGYTPGGIGPGGGQVAPGPAARDINIERLGPGGTSLAPGPAGSVNTGPTLRTPQAVRSSRNFAIAREAARRAPHRHKRKRRAH